MIPYQHPDTGPAVHALPRAGPAHGLSWPLAWVALQALLLLLALMSVACNLLALLLYPLLPPAAGRRFGRAMIARAYATFWAAASASGLLRLQAGVLEALRSEPGLIVVANHPSMLDAMVLAARLPLAACIMKASLMRNPLLGPGARLARYIPNDSAHAMVQRAVRDLRDGGQLLLFPEGTRTTRAPVNPFSASCTLIARRARAPIQAVFIDTDSPYLGKGWPLWRLPPLPICFSVRLGRRFEPAADHRALLAEIEAHYAHHAHCVAGVQRPAPAA
jgi:1-acyl-sn-glycerol-3-phosphate acyltransferase